MAFEFPNSPTVGQKYPETPVAGVPTYTWDGQKWVGDTAGPALALPKMDGAAAVGTSLKYSREDHVHPSNTAAVQKAGDTMTGHLSLPTSPAAANAVRKDYVDAAIAATPAPDLSTKVSKTGDSMSGSLNVNPGNVTANAGSITAVNMSASSSMNAFNITANNNVQVGNQFVGTGSGMVLTSSGYDTFVATANNAATAPMYLQASHQVGVRYFWRFILPNGAPYFDFRSEGDATSQNGGLWQSYSDARIKTVTGTYDSGLAEVVALNPVRYTFKGNETDNPPDQPIGVGADGKKLPRTGDPGVAPYETSCHYPAAKSGREFIGLVAQEAEVPMPETVTQTPGYIDGVPVDDLRLLDGTPIMYALVNAVKELKARVEQLESAAAR